MGFVGDSTAGLPRDIRVLLEGDLRLDSCGDWESDFLAESDCDSEADSRRDSQRDLQGDLRGDVDSASRASA